MTNLQAIDLLKGLEQSLDDYCELNDEGKTAFRMAITALEVFGLSEQLPAAQPGIIRCKDCMYHGINECFHKLGMIASMDDGFCSYAERRTDETD